MKKTASIALVLVLVAHAQAGSDLLRSVTEEPQPRRDSEKECRAACLESNNKCYEMCYNIDTPPCYRSCDRKFDACTSKCDESWEIMPREDGHKACTDMCEYAGAYAGTEYKERCERGLSYVEEGDSGECEEICTHREHRTLDRDDGCVIGCRCGKRHH